jgi:DNA primase
MEIEAVTRELNSAAGRGPAAPAQRGVSDAVQRSVADPKDPRSLVEREALKLALQEPVLAGPMFDSVDESVYAHPLHIAVRLAVAEAGGVTSATGGAGWIEAVRDASGDLGAKALVGELAVEPLRVDGAPDPNYVVSQISRLQLFALNRRVADVKSRLQRVNPVTEADEYHRLFGELLSLEQHARALREQTSGGL